MASAIALSGGGAEPGRGRTGRPEAYARTLRRKDHRGRSRHGLTTLRIAPMVRIRGLVFVQTDHVRDGIARTEAVATMTSTVEGPQASGGVARPRPTPSRPPALRLEGVRKSYGRTQALQSIDLTVAEGEFFTMLGPSGSGKATLL